MLNGTRNLIPRLGLLAVLLGGCARGKDDVAMQLASHDFQEGQPIPKRYTCDGPDVSPELHWQGVPAGTQSLVLIVDDPDAPRGTWVHWVLYNLPADVHNLPEHMSTDRELPSGAKQGENDFGKIGFRGPCPPAGKPHRYFFKLYALSQPLDLPAGATKHQVEAAMKGHILGEAHLMGTYGR